MRIIASRYMQKLLLQMTFLNVTLEGIEHENSYCKHYIAQNRANNNTGQHTNNE